MCGSLILQCVVAARCSVLLHCGVAVCGTWLPHSECILYCLFWRPLFAVCCSVLQCVAVCRSVLQCVVIQSAFCIVYFDSLLVHFIYLLGHSPESARDWHKNSIDLTFEKKNPMCEGLFPQWSPMRSGLFPHKSPSFCKRKSWLSRTRILFVWGSLRKRALFVQDSFAKEP